MDKQVGERLRELEAKATKGPWKTYCPQKYTYVTGKDGYYVIDRYFPCPNPVDAELICLMRNHLHELLEAEELLSDANEALRSAFAIAKRNGAQTNWETWTKRLEKILDTQHAHMYPNAPAAEEKA